MRNPEPNLPITIRDLSRVLGLSRAAISMALRDNPKIPESTRQRVKAMAREMGYEPNPNAAALSHFKWSSTVKPVQAALAWLNTWPEHEKLRSYKEYNHYWLGADAAAKRFGYHLEEFAVDLHQPLHRLQQILIARGISGILLPPYAPHVSQPDWGEFDWDHFTAVRVGRRIDIPPVHFVTSAQARNTMLAFEKIQEKGYQRIGFAGKLHENMMFGAGFLWAQQKLPQSSRLQPFLFQNPHRSAENQCRLEAWLKKSKPDAILTEIPELPQMLKKAGCRVPEEIGLAATSVLDCPIDAGVDQNPEEIGRIAMLTLISRINDYTPGIPLIPHEILVRGTWVDGASLPFR